MTQSSKHTANLCRHLVDAANHSADKLAVAVQQANGLPWQAKTLSYQEISFAELNRLSDRMAHALCQQGIKPGMKAVLMVTPSVDFLH